MEARRQQLLQDPNVYPQFYKPGEKPPSRSSPSIVSISSSSSGSSGPKSLPSVTKNNRNHIVIVSSDEEGDAPAQRSSQPSTNGEKPIKSQILATLDRALPAAPLQRTAVPAPIELPQKLRVSSNADVPTWETFDAPDERDLHDPRMSAAEAEKALRALVEDTVNSTEETEIDMSEAIVPGFVEGIKLLPHQVTGRNWMRERETGKKTGGILADDMGLGKTIQTLTRIVEGRAKKADKEDGWAASTLVICPVSLVSQWASEISRMAVGLRVIEHHGQSRTTDPSKLRQAHVVVTSYSTVASEYSTFAPEVKGEGKSKKSKSSISAASSNSDSGEDLMKKFANKKKAGKSKDALFQVHWFRVVLDEAHNIKNRNTKSAIACCALESKFRWCLTGTPMQNNVEELYSLIKFLRIRPLNDWNTFNEQIAQPVKGGRPTRAMKRLQVVLKSIMLRRTKNQILNGNGKPLLELPERNLELVECSFSDTEKDFYRLLETRMSSAVDELVQSDKHVNYTHVLVLLLRLRQACNHPSLVTKDFHIDKDATEPKAAKDDEDGTEDLASVFRQLGVSSGKKCHLCQRVLSAGSDATHCKECQPLVKTAQPTSDLPPKSAKIKKIMDILKTIDERSEGVEKTIIFSQFTTMLDLIEPFLDAQGIKHVRYDGSMTKDKREASLEKIRNSKSTRCILISFKAGSTGLNLTACNNVILVDMWWNPALEDQAYDRAHRFGQTRDVNIYKLMIPDTVETRILQLQDAKRELAKAALSGDKIKNMKLGLDDLLALFRGGGRYDDDDD